MKTFLQDDCKHKLTETYLNRVVLGPIKLNTDDIHTRPVFVAKKIDEKYFGKSSAENDKYHQQVLPFLLYCDNSDIHPLHFCIS